MRWGWLSLSCWLAAACAPKDDRGFQVREDVVYGEVEGQPLLLDLYLPREEGEGLRPAVIAIHGGGWQGGSRKDMGMAAGPLAQRGYVVASISYRLAPQWHYPAQLDDVQRAVRWVRRHAHELGVDPGRLGAIGGSAGGHLANLLGVRETRDDSLDPELAGLSSKVQCVVDVVGPTDLRLPGYLQGLARFPTGDTLRQVLEAFLGVPYEQNPDLWHEASPLFHVSRDDAPFFILHGTEDELVPVDQATRFAQALREAGVEVEEVIIEGLTHDIGQPPELKPKVDEAVAAAWEFMDRHLKEAKRDG